MTNQKCENELDTKLTKCGKGYLAHFVLKNMLDAIIVSSDLHQLSDPRKCLHEDVQDCQWDIYVNLLRKMEGDTTQMQ